MRMLYNNPLVKPLLASTEKGADQLVWLAETEPGVSWQPGRYYEKRKLDTPVNPQAGDAQLAAELWETSKRLCALQDTGGPVG